MSVIGKYMVVIMPYHVGKAHLKVRSAISRME